MQIQNSVITFLRGDDDALLVGLKTGAFEAGDEVYFCLKAAEKDATDILQIVATTFVDYTPVGASAPVANAGALINIRHLDTSTLPLGSYFYTIWVKWADNTYKTLVVPTKFMLNVGGSHG
jgi:hypothetical protein